MMVLYTRNMPEFKCRHLLNRWRPRSLDRHQENLLKENNHHNIKMGFARSPFHLAFKT
jgi:hypothetical protein